MDIRINSYIPITDVEGVGTRFVIWVQGCTLRCKGCANSHMWDTQGGNTYKTDEIFRLIESYKDRVEGVTFLGGEPLEQIEAITEISQAVQEIGLSVIVFTGYEYDALKDKKEFRELVKYVDILIDGRYEQDKQDFSRAWVGSSNQKYYYFSNRYNDEIVRSCKNKIEVRISPDNKIVMTGMGDIEELKEIVMR